MPHIIADVFVELNFINAFNVLPTSYCFLNLFLQEHGPCYQPSAITHGDSSFDLLIISPMFENSVENK